MVSLTLANRALFAAVALLILLVSSAQCEEKETRPLRAVAVLTGTGTVRGNVTFEQKTCGQPTLLTVYVVGLPPNAQVGFHVHEKGDLTQHCTSLGAHYNPDKVNHGARDSEVRHVGDLGNLKADANGVVETQFSDAVISLVGGRGIVGRGVIVHEGTDDLGLGGHQDSLKTGNAGGRAACGVVGIALDNDGEMPSCPSGAARVFGTTVAVAFFVGLAIIGTAAY